MLKLNMKKKLVTYFFIEEILSISAMGVALFWSAGRIDWWPGWAVVAVWLAWFAATDILLLRFHPDLLAERLKPPEGAKSWDKTILSGLRLLQLARYILAGLDQRYDWTGGFPLAAQIAALTVCILSYALVTWAMASNNYFSQVVRIQSDRGHTVAMDGPYRYMRHPSYTGMILFELAMGILLASWWALLFGGLCAVLIILRTALEDHTLQTELVGYGDYSRQVRYHLIPGIW
jgi:protein-S-isoprenylcysteine O-methyltransferase Ste14